MYAANSENPWMRDVANASRRIPAWIAAAAAALFAIAVLQVFKTWGAALQENIVGAVSHFPGPWPDILASAAMQGLIFGLFLAAALAATRIEGRPLWRQGPGRLSSGLTGALVGSGGFGTAVGIAAVAGAVTVGAGPTPPSPLSAIAFGAAVVALQSVAEEAFFRGWLQPVLCARWGAWPGLLVASLLFAGLHIIAGVQGPLTGEGAFAVVNLFLGGVLFGLLALRTGNLFAPAAAHFAWNWTESGVLGLNPDPSGSLVSLTLTGAKLWNGGLDTMNGSLATTLVLTALVVSFLFLPTRHPPTGR